MSSDGSSDEEAPLPLPSGSTSTSSAAGHRKLKERRTNLACEACHRSKIRCSGSHPCVSCIKKSLDCVFPDPNLRPPRRSKKQKLAEDRSTGAPPSVQPSSSTALGAGTASGDILPQTSSRDPFASSSFGARYENAFEAPGQAASWIASPHQHHQGGPSSWDPSNGTSDIHPTPFYQDIVDQDPPPAPDLVPFTDFGVPAPLPSVRRGPSSSHLHPPQLMSSSAARRHCSAVPSIPPSAAQTTSVRQPYFRWLGPTAIAPPSNSSKFREISLSVEKAEEDQARPKHGLPPSGPFFDPSLPPSLPSSSFFFRPHPPHPDPEHVASALPSGAPTRSPSPEPGWESGRRASSTLPRMPTQATLDVFYDSFDSFMPYMSREDLRGRIEQGTASEVLLCAMAAISERIKPSDPGASPSAAERYAERAKRLILPHLSLPSLDLVYSLSLIAVHEFGEDRDSGLWQWQGMAIRMAIDLGLHMQFSSDQATTLGVDEGHLDLRRRVFWCVVCLDRIISCGTGRVCTIPLEQIEVDLPPPSSFLRDSSGRALTDPFPWLCRLLLLLGEVSDELNGFLKAKERRTLSSFTFQRSGPLAGVQSNAGDTLAGSSSAPALDASSPSIERLHSKMKPFQIRLADFHAETPVDLQFNVHNFQSYSSAKSSQAFLLISLWSHAISLAVYSPSLVYPKGISTLEVPLDDGPSRSSTISIADMLAFADLIDPHSYRASPWASQPTLMAGSAAVLQMRNAAVSAQSPESSSSSCSSTVHHSAPFAHNSDVALQRSEKICSTALERGRMTWAGWSWLIDSLTSLKASEQDVILRHEGKIKSRDKGLVRKAQIGENARQWLRRAVGTLGDGGPDSFLGMSVAGTLDDPQQSSFSVLGSGGSVAQPVPFSDLALARGSEGTSDLAYPNPIDARGPTFDGQQEGAVEDDFIRSLMSGLVSSEDVMGWVEGIPPSN